MKKYLAISVLTWDNQLSAHTGQPAHERDFDSEAEARHWLLKEKRGGGAIRWHDGSDFRSIKVEAGE